MRALAAILVLAAAAAAPVTAGEGELVNELGEGDISVSVLPAFGSHFRLGQRRVARAYYRPGEPVPLSLIVTNAGGAAEAVVSVAAGGEPAVRFSTRGGASLTGRRKIELSPMIGGPGAGPVVEVSSPEGRALFRARLADVLSPLGAGERLVVCAADHAYGEMGARAPSGRIAPDLAARVCEVPAGALPGRASDYAGVDLLIVDELTPAGLSARQREALAVWVRSGGRFIISSRRALIGLRDILFTRRGPGEPSDWESWKRVYGGSDSDVVLRKDGHPAIVRLRSGLGRGVTFGFSVREGGKSDWAGAGADEYRRLLAGAARPGGDARIRPELFDALPPRTQFSEVVLRIRAAVVAFIVVFGILIALALRRGAGRLRVLATVGGASLVLALGAAAFVPRPVTASLVFSVAEVAPDGSAMRRSSYSLVTSFSEAEFSTGELPRGALVRALAFDWGELRSHSYTVEQGDSLRLVGLTVRRDLPALIEASSAELTSASAGVPVAPPGGGAWVLRHSSAGDLSTAAVWSGGRARRVPSADEPAYGEPLPVREYVEREFAGDDVRLGITRHFVERAARDGGAFIFGWRAPRGEAELAAGAEAVRLGELLIVHLEEAER